MAHYAAAIAIAHATTRADAIRQAENALDPYGEDSFTNPDPAGYWDWYEVGEDGFYRLTDGTRADIARVRDIDFTAMEAEDGDTPAWMTPALVTSDGDWHARAVFDTFCGESEEMPHEEFVTRYRSEIKNLPDEAWLVLMDLHV